MPFAADRSSPPNDGEGEGMTTDGRDGDISQRTILCLELLETYRMKIRAMSFPRLTDGEVADAMEFYCSDSFVASISGEFSDDTISLLSMLLFERVPLDIAQKFLKAYRQEMALFSAPAWPPVAQSSRGRSDSFATVRTNSDGFSASAPSNG